MYKCPRSVLNNQIVPLYSHANVPFTPLPLRGFRSFIQSTLAVGGNSLRMSRYSLLFIVLSTLVSSSPVVSWWVQAWPLWLISVQPHLGFSRMKCSILLKLNFRYPNISVARLESGASHDLQNFHSFLTKGLMLSLPGLRGRGWDPLVQAGHLTGIYCGTFLAVAHFYLFKGRHGTK